VSGASGFLEGLVVSLREGVEVALVIGVLFAYLNRTGRGAYLRYVILGLGVAILASVMGALLVRRYGLNPDNPAVEGSLMFVAAALVASLLIWMWRTGRTVRRRLEGRLETLVSGSEATAGTARAALGVFAFTFFMVFREGVETVLFLTALSGTAGSRPLSTALGTGLGCGLAVLFGVLLVRGSVHINLSRFFAVTGLVLVVLVLKLVAGGLHEFFEAGLLPGIPVWEEAVELFTSTTASLVMLVLLIVAPLSSLAWDWWRATTPHTPEQPNGAHP
jgi:high-affinity iron transporter